MKTVLVTGGAGYVGSHAVKHLSRKGFGAVVLDDFSKGHAKFLGKTVRAVKGDVRDKKVLDRIFSENRIDGVFHFAALAMVGESVRKPSLYREVNVGGTRNLLRAMARHGVGRIVFSSTAAVYGNPRSVPITEGDPCRPVNPYGRTKLNAEKLLRLFEEKHGIRYASLRYFNAAGAGYGIGEKHDPESHLIPILLRAARKGGRARIFGDDYPTKDGTCIRDYVHVVDLAEAHYLAFRRLGRKSCTYNLGSGKGFSVREVLDVCREVTGKPIPAGVSARREGDPAVLVAGNSRIRKELGWKPRRGLRRIVGSAWEWHRRNG